MGTKSRHFPYILIISEILPPGLPSGDGSVQRHLCQRTPRCHFLRPQLPRQSEREVLPVREAPPSPNLIPEGRPPPPSLPPLLPPTPPSPRTPTPPPPLHRAPPARRPSPFCRSLPVPGGRRSPDNRSAGPGPSPAPRTQWARREAPSPPNPAAAAAPPARPGPSRPPAALTIAAFDLHVDPDLDLAEVGRCHRFMG